MSGYPSRSRGRHWKHRPGNTNRTPWAYPAFSQNQSYNARSSNIWHGERWDRHSSWNYPNSGNNYRQVPYGNQNQYSWNTDFSSDYIPDYSDVPPQSSLIPQSSNLNSNFNSDHISDLKSDSGRTNRNDHSMPEGHGSGARCGKVNEKEKSTLGHKQNDYKYYESDRRCTDYFKESDRPEKSRIKCEKVLEHKQNQKKVFALSRPLLPDPVVKKSSSLTHNQSSKGDHVKIKGKSKNVSKIAPKVSSPSLEDKRQDEITRAAEKLKRYLQQCNESQEDVLENLLSKQEGQVTESKAPGPPVDKSRFQPELHLTARDLQDIGNIKTHVPSSSQCHPSSSHEESHGSPVLCKSSDSVLSDIKSSPQKCLSSNKSIPVNVAPGTSCRDISPDITVLDSPSICKDINKTTPGKLTSSSSQLTSGNKCISSKSKSPARQVSRCSTSSHSPAHQSYKSPAHSDSKSHKVSFSPGNRDPKVSQNSSQCKPKIVHRSSGTKWSYDRRTRTYSSGSPVRSASRSPVLAEKSVRHASKSPSQRTSGPSVGSVSKNSSPKSSVSKSSKNDVNNSRSNSTSASKVSNVSLPKSSCVSKSSDINLSKSGSSKSSSSASKSNSSVSSKSNSSSLKNVSLNTFKGNTIETSNAGETRYLSELKCSSESKSSSSQKGSNSSVLNSSLNLGCKSSGSSASKSSGSSASKSSPTSASKDSTSLKSSQGASKVSPRSSRSVCKSSSSAAKSSPNSSRSPSNASKSSSNVSKSSQSLSKDSGLFLTDNSNACPRLSENVSSIVLKNVCTTPASENIIGEDMVQGDKKDLGSGVSIMPSLTSDVEFISCVSPKSTLKDVDVIDLCDISDKNEVSMKDVKYVRNSPFSLNSKNCIRVSIEKDRLGKGNQFESVPGRGVIEFSDTYVLCSPESNKKICDHPELTDEKNCMTNEVPDVLQQLHSLPVDSFAEQEPGSQSGDRVSPRGSCENLPISPLQVPCEVSSERPTTRLLFMPNLVPSRSRHSSETVSPNIDKHVLDTTEKDLETPGKRAKRSRSASSNVDVQDVSGRRKSFSGGPGSTNVPAKSFGEIINHQLKNINLKDMVNKPNFNRKAELVMQHLMKEHNQTINRQLRILAEARMLGKQPATVVEDSCGSLTLQDPLDIDPDLAVDLAALPPEFIENLQNLFDLDMGVPESNPDVPTNVAPPTDLEGDLNTSDVSDMFSSSILGEIVEPESLLIMEHVEKCIEQGTMVQNDHEVVELNDSKIDDLNLEGNLEYVERKIESLKQEIKSYEESDATIKNSDKLGDAINVKEEIFHIPDMPDNIEFIGDSDTREDQDSKDFINEFSEEQKDDSLFLATNDVCSTMPVAASCEALPSSSGTSESIKIPEANNVCENDDNIADAGKLIDANYLSESPALIVSNADEVGEEMLPSNITDQSTFQDQSPACTLDDAIISEDQFAIYDMGSDIVPEDRVSGYVVENGTLSSQAADIYDVDSLTQDQGTPYNADDSMPSIEAAAVYVGDDHLEGYSVDSGVLASAQDADICDEGTSDVQNSPILSDVKDTIINHTLLNENKLEEHSTFVENSSPVCKSVSSFVGQLQEKSISFAGSVSSFTLTSSFNISKESSLNKSDNIRQEEEKQHLDISPVSIDIDVPTTIGVHDESKKNNSEDSNHWHFKENASDNMASEEDCSRIDSQPKLLATTASPVKEHEINASPNSESSLVPGPRHDVDAAPARSPQLRVSPSQNCPQQQIIESRDSCSGVPHVVDSRISQSVSSDVYPREENYVPSQCSTLDGRESVFFGKCIKEDSGETAGEEELHVSPEYLTVASVSVDTVGDEQLVSPTAVPSQMSQDVQTSPLRTSPMDLDPRPTPSPPQRRCASFDACTQTSTDTPLSPSPAIAAVLQILQQWRAEGRGRAVEGAFPLRELESLLPDEGVRTTSLPFEQEAPSAPADEELQAPQTALPRERAPRRRERAWPATSHSVPRNHRHRRRNSSGSEVSAGEAEAMAPAREASWPGEADGGARRQRLSHHRSAGRHPLNDYDSADDAATGAPTPRGSDDLECSDNFDASETFREMLRVDKEMQWLLAYKMKLYKRLCRGGGGHMAGERPDMQVSSCSRPGEFGDEDDERDRRGSDDSESVLSQLAVRAMSAGVAPPGDGMSPPGAAYSMLGLGLGLGVGLGHARPAAPPSDPVCPSPQTTTLTPARESFSGSPSSASPRAPGFRTPGEASVAADSEGGASVHGPPAAAAGVLAPGLAGLGAESSGESPASGHASKSPDCSDASVRVSVPSSQAAATPGLGSTQSPPMVRFPADYCLSVCATSTLRGDGTRGSLESMLGLADCHGDAEVRPPSSTPDAAYDTSVVEDVINSALKEQSEIHELHDGDTERLLADVELAAATAAAAARSRKLEESLRLTDTSVVEAVLNTFALPECDVLGSALVPPPLPPSAVLRTPPSESKAEPDSTGCDPPHGAMADDEDFEDLESLLKDPAAVRRGPLQREGAFSTVRHPHVPLMSRPLANEEHTQKEGNASLACAAPRGRRGRSRRRQTGSRKNYVRSSPYFSDGASSPAPGLTVQTMITQDGCGDVQRIQLQPDSTGLSPAGACIAGSGDADAFLNSPGMARNRRPRKHSASTASALESLVPLHPEDAAAAPPTLEKVVPPGRGRGRRRRAPAMASPPPPPLPPLLAPATDETLAPSADPAAEPTFSSTVRTRRRARDVASLDAAELEATVSAPALAEPTSVPGPPAHEVPATVSSASLSVPAAITSSTTVPSITTTITFSGRRVPRKRKMDYAEIIEPLEKSDHRSDEERAMAPAPASVKAKRAKTLLTAKLNKESSKCEKSDKLDRTEKPVIKHDKRKRVKETGRERSPLIIPTALQSSVPLSTPEHCVTGAVDTGIVKSSEVSADLAVSSGDKLQSARCSTVRSSVTEDPGREDAVEQYSRGKGHIKSCYVLIEPLDISQYLNDQRRTDVLTEDEEEEASGHIDHDVSQDYWTADSMEHSTASVSTQVMSPSLLPSRPSSDPTQEIESQLALLEEMSNHIAASRDPITQELCKSGTATASTVSIDDASVPLSTSDPSQPPPLPPPPLTSSSSKRPRIDTPATPGGQTSPEDCDKDSVSSSDVGAPEGGDSPNKLEPKRKSRKRKRRNDACDYIAFEAHRGPVLDVKTVGRHVLAACEDGSVYCYSLKSGKLKRQYCGHSAAVICLAILVREGAGGEDPVPEFLFTGSLDHHLRCFQFKTGNLVNQPVNLGKPIQCMDENWGTIFLGTKMGEVAKFYTKSFKLNEDYLKCSKDSILAIKATKEGARKVVIVAARNEPVTIRDANSGLLMRVVGHNLPHTVYSLLLEQSLLYCGTKTGKIPVFSFTSGEEVCRYSAGYGVVCMRVYNQLLFAGCYDGNIYIYSTQDKSLVSCIPGPGKMLLCLDVVKNRIIAGSKDNKLQAWPLPAVVKNCIKESRHR